MAKETGPTINKRKVIPVREWPVFRGVFSSQSKLCKCAGFTRLDGIATLRISFAITCQAVKFAVFRRIALRSRPNSPAPLVGHSQCLRCLGHQKESISVRAPYWHCWWSRVENTRPNVFLAVILDQELSVFAFHGGDSDHRHENDRFGVHVNTVLKRVSEEPEI